jgi:hypothetical protein
MVVKEKSHHEEKLMKVDLKINEIQKFKESFEKNFKQWNDRNDQIEGNYHALVNDYVSDSYRLYQSFSS